MNRTFLLALALVFVFACNPQPATNYNGKGNSNSTANANRSDEGITGSNDKLVVITLGTKGPDDKYYLSVAPDKVEISVSKGEQVEWVVSNPFATVTLSDIKITNFQGGTTPNKDPFGNGGTFTFSSVGAQSISHQLSGRPGEDKSGTYTYQVSGTATVGGTTISLTMDPRVVVGG